jgi:BetI-type transcriptional repressor, C-terminal
MGENGHRVEVDPWNRPWNRLVALIDRYLDAAVHNQNLIIELWRNGMRDVELRDQCDEQWAGYRAPLLETVVEGCNQGAFSPTLSPGQVVDLVLAMLAGAILTPVSSADGFRIGLLQQLSQMLGRA